MASNKRSFLNSLMERKKPKDHGTNDELALVKAAAWAWYQHGSGNNEGKATIEFDVTTRRTRHAPIRPSRYKLEAMRSMDKEAKLGSPIHNKESLLDAYEVQSISRHLNRLLETNNHNKLVVNDANNNFANASVDDSDRRTKKKNKEKMRKGFWLRHASVCGREEDVVDPSALRDGRRHSTKSVPSVNLVKCLPISNTNGAM